MKAFITITGLKFHFGSKPFAAGQKVKLVKEPDNEYDSEAIKAELPGLGCAGYVANSPHTVLGDCISAGRLYDKIGLQGEDCRGRKDVRSMQRMIALLPCWRRSHFYSAYFKA